MKNLRWELVASVLILGLLALSTGVLAADEETVPKYGGTLTVALTGTIEIMDPQKSVMYPFNRSANFTIWEPLIRYVGGEERYEPFLAESWEFIDPQTLVLHLRQGVMFHDGTLFDAEDVKFTIERLKDPETAAPNAAYAEVIERVVPVDDYTVRLELSRPYLGILTNLDVIVMLSSESPPSPDRPPVGTGPFEFEEWVPGDHLILKRFPDYWQEGLPYLDALKFIPIPDEQTRIANLEADTVQYLPEITPEQIPRIKENKDLKLIVGTPGDTLRVVIFVTDVPPMDNVLIRRAVAHCLDREGFVASALYGLGTPTENIYAPHNPYYNEATARRHRYNLQRAKELFEEAGYPEKFPDEAWPLHITVPAGEPLSEKIAVMLQSSLRQIGIACEIERYDVPTWLEVRESKQMFVTFYTAGGLDPSIQLATNLLSPKGNIPHYYNDELIKLMEEGCAVTDIEKRKQIYFEIQEIIAEEVPFSVVACYPTVGAARSYVHGIKSRISEDLPLYHEAWLDK